MMKHVVTKGTIFSKRSLFLILYTTQLIKIGSVEKDPFSCFQERRETSKFETPHTVEN